MNQCIYFEEIMKVQNKVIINHLDEHKWFNHIEDKNEAVIDFIRKYGWIMREIFCETCELCSECDVKCELYKGAL